MSYIRVLLLLSLFFSFSFSDEIRPGYLEIKGSGAKTFQVKWKVPMKENMVLGIKPIMPESCKSTPPSRHKVGSALIENWTMVCPEGLAGQTYRDRRS